MCGVARGRLQSANDYPLDLCIAYFAGSAGSRLVQDTVESLFDGELGAVRTLTERRLVASLGEISALVGGMQSGGSWEQRWGGIQGAIWMFGIAVIAIFDGWWAGIMVLVGLSAIFGAISRNERQATSDK